jgi:hypothetical protein
MASSETIQKLELQNRNLRIFVLLGSFSRKGILMCLEHRLKAEPAATEADLLSHVQMAKEDFRGKP